MRTMSMRMAGLVAVLVMSGVLWIYGHGHGTGAGSGRAAYCHDVDRLTTVLSSIRQGGAATGQLGQLASIDTALTADASSAAGSGQSVAAATLTRLAADVSSWRTSIVTGDAVNQTIALDRILSEIASVPGC